MLEKQLGNHLECMDASETLLPYIDSINDLLVESGADTEFGSPDFNGNVVTLYLPYHPNHSQKHLDRVRQLAFQISSLVEGVVYDPQLDQAIDKDSSSKMWESFENTQDLLSQHHHASSKPWWKFW